MCGITGLVSFDGPIDLTDYYRAHLEVRHRGPDDEGFVALAESGGEMIQMIGDDTIPQLHSRPHVKTLTRARGVLGHRRLSIIDLSEHGHQPLLDENEVVSIIYNGEVFNYIELREELRGLGYSFRTQTDTEVVLKAYLEWGPDSFNKFNGMWAFAIYDVRSRELILSRDRFGIKPLYFAQRGASVVFGSEVKFIRAALNGRLKLDPQRAAGYLSRCDIDSSESTFWSDVREVLPAHSYTFSDRGLHRRKYWKFQPRLQPRTYDDAVDELAALFKDSVRLRMRSDVEVGSLLSGGLDSNTIVFTLKELGLLSNGTFNTFSAVFHETEYDEKKYIDDAVEKVNVRTHFVRPDPQKLLEDFDLLFRHIEVPFRSFSIYSQFALYREVKSSTAVKVVLNGQGADELFAGYNFHYNYALADQFRTLRLGSFLATVNMLRNHRGRGLRSIFNRALATTFVRSLALANYSNSQLFDELIHNSLREYLHYDDRNAMAFGIEARVPYLDYRIVEFAFSIPFEFKIRGSENKSVLRSYARRMVPTTIVDRKDKMGFVSPQERWQRTVLASFFDGVIDRVGRDGFETIKDPTAVLESFHAYKEGNDAEWLNTWRGVCLKLWEERQTA